VSIFGRSQRSYHYLARSFSRDRCNLGLPGHRRRLCRLVSSAGGEIELVKVVDGLVTPVYVTDAGWQRALFVVEKRDGADRGAGSYWRRRF
jgi:hypothetical protein